MLRRKLRKTPRTWLMMTGSIGVLAGLGVARFRWEFDGRLLLMIAALTAMALHKHRRRALLCVFMFGGLIGVWRGAAFLAQVDRYQELYGKTVTLDVTASTDGYYEDGQYSFDASAITAQSPVTYALPGKGVVRTQGISSIARGDRLRVTGRMYRTRGSRQFGVSYAQGTVISSQHFWTDTLRQRFAAGVRNVLPEPLSSFGLGLLVGQRVDLPDAVSDDLSRAGLTHIIAVSGYNLTIIIQAVRRRFSGRSKYQATVGALLLMLGFVLITGFSASIVRASLVSVLSLWAWYYGRSIRPVLLVLLPAALTALWNPLYLWSDIGWYLSFLAFFGVLVIAPLWEERRMARAVRSTAVGQLVREALAAQIMTIPIIMYIFARISTVGLLANIVIVPLVPLAMLLVTVAGVGGMVLPAWAGWVGMPATVLLNYMLDMTHVLASLNHAVVSQPLTLTAMLVLYACLLVMVCILWKKSPKNAMLTDREGKLNAEDIHVRTQQMVNN
ncbi:ComEC family competence protein [Patescibacteria group bacterium]|nr:MAG: ComEC family competence protein [Patescibacteria group bacterium]